MILHVKHRAKNPPTISANQYLMSATETEIYGFLVSELLEEMKAQNENHFKAGKFNILKHFVRDWGMEEFIEYDPKSFEGVPDHLLWWVMREDKLEEAVRYGGAKFRVYQRQYLRDNYVTTCDVLTEMPKDIQ